ncbi:MAG: tripartite tricarboxylate transporter substrate binding protein, partial [Burkholderiales bacterium]|nr:tripartite tricarboxylate transporter substrate binding protein [Burkholderiales bacterium]
NRTVKIIVGFAPGGLTDAYARLFAEAFTERFKVPCVVENRPGAGANIAIDAVVKSPADGYTLLATTTGAVWQNRVLYRKLPFDLAKDIDPITVFPSGPLIVAVQDKLPIRNFNELVEYARKNPMIMGSYAPASYPHMFAEGLNKLGGKVETVHYKGEGPMWVEFVTGAQQIAVGSYQAFATVMAKGARPIAATTATRCPKLPDVPTLLEQGMKSELANLDGGLALTGLRENFAIPMATKGRADALRMWREQAPVWIREADALGVKLD